MAESYEMIKEHGGTHVSQQASEGKFKCLLCPYGSNHKVALTIHSVIHKTSSPYKCAVCDNKQFESVSLLDGHIRTHTGENRHSCAYKDCGYSSNHSTNMNRHYRLKHHSVIPAKGDNSYLAHSFILPPKKYRFRCYVCQFVTAHRTALSMHQVVHRSSSPFTCSRCKESGFQTAKKFSIHIQRHFGEAKFFCDRDECFYTSSHSGNIARHERMRHGDDAEQYLEGDNSSLKSVIRSGEIKPEDQQSTQPMPDPPKPAFECKKCKFTTQNAQNWRLHKLKHTRRYACSLCAYKSFSSGMMRKHYAKVHRTQGPACLNSTAASLLVSKKYSCDMCDFSSVTVGGLRQHVEQLHTVKRCAMCNYQTVDSNHYNKHVEVCFV